MERRKLTLEEINERMAGLEGWEFVDDKIEKKFKFANFADAFAFINRVGEIADAADHHPDIKFGWGYAEIETTTHDRGGVTDFDLHLAEKINAIGA